MKIASDDSQQDVRSIVKRGSTFICQSIVSAVLLSFSLVGTVAANHQSGGGAPPSMVELVGVFVAIGIVLFLAWLKMR